VLQPFDSEDTVWGYRLHDLTMALLDLTEDEGVEGHDRLLPAMRRGYERYLPRPEDDVVAPADGPGGMAAQLDGSPPARMLPG
jgi:hypothetical protein